MLAQPVVHTENEIAKPYIKDVSLKEVENCNIWLEKLESPGYR